MNAKKNCLIISGGDYSPINNILNYDYCIACDKGYEYSRRMDIIPDVIVGDYDSYEGDITSTVNSGCYEEGKSPKVITFPKEKDDTDTMLAVKHALRMGIEQITICCALGGRMDHTIANISTMLYVVTHGGVCEIVSECDHMILTSADYINNKSADLFLDCRIDNKKIILPRKNHCSLSLFALSGNCEGVNIRGTKYEVSNITLHNDTSLGASNEWKDNEATIEIGRGILLIIMSQIPI